MQRVQKIKKVHDNKDKLVSKASSYIQTGRDECMMMLCMHCVEKGDSNSIRRFARRKRLPVYLSVGLVFVDAICGAFDSPLSRHTLIVVCTWLL
jgi:hypothetical protein